MQVRFTGLLTADAPSCLRSVICRFTLALAAVAAVARAAGPDPFAPEAASNLSQPVVTAAFSDTDFSGNADYRGSAEKGPVFVRLNGGRTLLTADEMHYRRPSNTLTAIGHVTMTDGEDRLLADYFEYHRGNGTFLARNVRLGRYPIYIRGTIAEGTPKEITVHDAVVSYTDPGRWKPSIKAKTIVYSPGKYLRMVRSMVGLSGAEILPLGAITQNLNEAFASQLLTLNLGYYTNLGGFADIGAHVDGFPGSRVGGDLTLYTKRGVMAGPSGTYADPDGSGDWHGMLESGFIKDYGNTLPDLLTGEPIPGERGFVEFEHQQEIDDDLSITADFNYWGDPDVLRDFKYHEFKATQVPENFVETVYTGDDFLLSAFAQMKLNNFEDVQQETPEVRYDLLPTQIGGGVVERFAASTDILRETFPSDNLDLASDRVDAFYGLSRPINPTDWFNFTPVVGGRLTDYFDTQGAPVDQSYLRALGEIGFDSQLRASGTFDYENPTWGIDGLRHLLTPEISYRYIPEGGAGQEYIPEIQRDTFTTYLTPIELGDMSAIDQIQALNTLRLAVDNVLQTRDSGYGSRDLVELNVADDLNFLRTQAEPDFSDLHAEMRLMPASWIELDSDQILNLQTLTLREFDTALTIKDDDAWNIQVATNFLRREDDYYILNYQVRLNEVYQGIVRVGYNARAFRFDERAIGLIQNLANTWRLQYLLTVNDGPNRLGKLGLQVEVDVVRF